MPVPDSPLYGPSRGSRCGIYYLTHHPMLVAYLASAVERLGDEPAHVFVASVAAASALALWWVARASPWGATLLAAELLAALWCAPGYAAWLAHPVGHTPDRTAAARTPMSGRDWLAALCMLVLVGLMLWGVTYTPILVPR